MIHNIEITFNILTYTPMLIIPIFMLLNKSIIKIIEIFTRYFTLVASNSRQVLESKSKSAGGGADLASQQNPLAVAVR